MSSNWNSVMNKYLSEFENQTTVALEQINEALIKSGKQFDGKIKEYFANSIRNRLDQALDFFEIQHATSQKETTHQIPNVENDGTEMGVKVELSSEDESSVSENFPNSGEAEALPSYSRLNSVDSYVDQRSMCSPSNSNLPNNTPIVSPEPQMWNFLGPIKIEPNESQFESIIFAQTHNESNVKTEDVPTASNLMGMFADTSHELPNPNIMITTNTCTATSASLKTSGQGCRNDSSHAMNSSRRESLKRMHSVDMQHEEAKKQKIEQEIKNDKEVINNEPTQTIRDRKIMFACFHCHKSPHMPEMCETFEEVQNHWAHTHQSLPFQFYAIGVAACYYCKDVQKIRSYEQHQQHHKFRHSSEIMIVVDQQNHSKCGLCHKMLSSSEMALHFKQEHSQRSLNGISSPICFTQDEINYLSTLNSSQSGIKSFICGLCGVLKHTAETSFREHIQNDSFLFKCSNCDKWKENLAELVDHEEEEHDLFNTWSKEKNLEPLITEFNNRLQRYYLRTRIIFNNGLVLFNHNILNTNFDDREAFWRFKAKFAEKKIHQNVLEIEKIHRNAVINKDKLLRQQRRYNRNLCIIGFPRLPKELIRKVFISICDAIGMMISDDDIEDAFQRKGNDIIVKMKERPLKGEIQRQWKQIDTASFSKKFKSLLNKLQISEDIRIFINSDFTGFFKPLWAYAEKVKKSGRIFNCFMNDEGLMIIKTIKGKKHVIWSTEELDKYVRSKEM